MQNRYSRMISTEEKRNIKSAATFMVLSITILVLLFVFGIPAVGRIAGFMADLKTSNSSIKSNDKTPPVPPRFNSYKDNTNSQYLTISGTAEPGAKLKLILNGDSTESIVDKEGRFTFTDLSLNEGENKFTAVVIDNAGNTSQPTDEKIVIYDNKPPELTLESPTDGTKYYGSTQRQINLQGGTEANASVTVNDRVVSLNSEGKFQYPVTLNSGDNSFNFKVTDLAGNQFETTITVSFSE